jgi:hypothetical protein
MAGVVTPYSVRIYLGSLAANASSPNITPPSGYIYVITDVGAWQAFATGSYVNLGDIASGLQLLALNTVSGWPYGHWQGRVVIPAGTSFHVTAAASPANVVVNGYQLSTT